MSVVCETCGDVGWDELLIHCNKCKNATRHQYCCDATIYDGSLVDWMCNDCHQKHNQANESLDVSNKRQQILGSSIINESNAKKLELTEGLWSWGHYRNRSCKGKRDFSDAITEHFPSGNTSISSEMISGEISKKNDSGKEVGCKNVHSTLGHSEGAKSFKNSNTKKQRRLIIPYDEEDDAEAVRLDDLNNKCCEDDDFCEHCEDDDPVKHKSEVENGLENEKMYVKNSEEAFQPEILNRRSSDNHTQVNKQRSMGANGDESAALGDPNAGCAQNGIPQLVVKTVVMENSCSLSSTPLVQEYICARPVDKPYWTGTMKICGDYIPLAAHLSTKACKKVLELSTSLPQIMEVTEIPMSKVWPKSWEESGPASDSIGLFFFSDNMRPNKELDQLVKRVTDCRVVLETAVGFTKLQIFPSVVLPADYQLFQGKHYLWGVFKRRKEKNKRVAD